MTLDTDQKGELSRSVKRFRCFPQKQNQQRICVQKENGNGSVIEGKTRTNLRRAFVLTSDGTDRESDFSTPTLVFEPFGQTPEGTASNHIVDIVDLGQLGWRRPFLEAVFPLGPVHPQQVLLLRDRTEDIRLSEKGNSNSHGARPVHQIILMTYSGFGPVF